MYGKVGFTYVVISVDYFPTIYCLFEINKGVNINLYSRGFQARTNVDQVSHTTV